MGHSHVRQRVFIPSDKVQLDQLSRHEKQWLCLRKGHKPIPEVPSDSFLGLLVITRGLCMLHSVETDSIPLPTGELLGIATLI